MAKINLFNGQNDTGQTPWEQYQNRYKKNQKNNKKQKFFNKFKFHVQFNTTLIKFLVSLLFLFTILLFLVYLVSPLSRVNSKFVKGTNELNANKLINSIPIKKGDSIIHTLDHQHTIEATFLKRNPQIESTSMYVRNWNQIGMKIKEYGTAGYLYSKNRYYIVVDNGEIINKYLSSPDLNKPIFVNFKPNNNLKSITQQYQKLPSSLKKNIVKIIKSPTSYDVNRIKVEMHDKNIVYARSDTFADKMSYYPSIVSKIKQPSIINLEVGAYSYPIKSKK